uniref:Uncharacterized protein n=1 Tax=Candidatus Kentrum sp. MB TaxID=2138164 RepID=A0A451B959_9GAMM|nr:MAG: hypothetical protein BECKMB1821I_GA0114274_101032 [Candidatus Kentron sp. MB]VFK74805.1 MAG: hypothetical protein BECKMB1821H_GA0114242_101032 [Candidatus Kentron sp. MB]
MNSKISKSGLLKGIGGLGLAAVLVVLMGGCGSDNEPPKLSEQEKKATEERIAPVGKLRTE